MTQWVLGLDIGSASIGWALVDRAGQRLGAAGVRIFPAGVDDAKFEKGLSGASNNTERRRLRLQRRQIRRRARRQRALFLLLQQNSLLPGPYDPSALADLAASPKHRHDLIDALDAHLLLDFAGELSQLPAPAQVLPYFLRARTLDYPLEPHALGRVFYHLGQRRGFKSNRREARSERDEKHQAAEDERSEVKSGISELQQAIEASKSRTLGEYFSRLDPSAPGTKIRRRWTGRSMYEAEFDAIWAAQAPYHAALTEELRQRIHDLVFSQRPVGAGRPGRCELEPTQPRAPAASLAFQRFRLLQRLNDLRVVAPDLQEFPISPGERAALLETLECEGSLKFSEIKKRKLVALARGYHFNLERGGEKTMPGNQTAVALRGVFGGAWDNMPPGEREAAVAAWLNTEDEAEFARLGREQFGLSGAALEAWSGLRLASGYGRLSAVALSKLLPRMEAGEPFKTVETAIYGDRYSGGQVWEQLRPVAKALPELANPAVMRALSELRSLVNALVREYGKPHEIRIELARDIKRNAKQRQRLSEGIREQEARRKEASARILAETGIAEPSRADIERARLHKQARGLCPYCGLPISFRDAFSAEAAEVDHILPRSRFPDDSFANKVLAHYRCNQQKRGRTPFEAFGHEPELWAQILERVRSWDDETKLRAFQITDPAQLDAGGEDTFAARRLNDTRYATKQAARYLGELYGGRDVAGRRVIHASSGLVTATLRRGWALEEILGRHNEKGKNREDHRHHAVDAVVIAISCNAAVQQLSVAAAADPSGQGRVSSKTLVAPWPDFVDSVRPVIEAIQVSHRPSHRLRGSLHNDTVYSRPHPGARAPVAHVRHRVESLSKAAAGKIVDRRVREAVMAKLAEVGGDAKKLADNWPLLRTCRGAMILIRKVRIRDRPAEGLAAVPRGLVAEGGNHHVALFAGRDERGRERWQARIVSRLEAARRKSAGKPIVERAWDGEGEFEFLFSLMGGDLVEMGSVGGGPAGRFVVRTISESTSGHIELDFVADRLASQVADLKKAGQWVRVTSLDELRRRGCRKVTADVLGRIHEAHD